MPHLKPMQDACRKVSDGVQAIGDRGQKVKREGLLAAERKQPGPAGYSEFLVGTFAIGHG